jgi:HTH-type transcriptional regulator/antitoxin HigA
MIAVAEKKMQPIATKKLNAARYARLLSKTLPVAIKTEAEYDRMLKVVNALMSAPEDKLTAEEGALLDLLAALIERYEEEHYPIADAPGHRILASLLKERGLKQSDLLSVFKSRGVISELVSGKRPIGPKVARKLGKFFGVNPAVFLPLEQDVA